jgi:hypothetical protein
MALMAPHRRSSLHHLTAPPPLPSSPYKRCPRAPAPPAPAPRPFLTHAQQQHDPGVTPEAAGVDLFHLLSDAILYT